MHDIGVPLVWSDRTLNIIRGKNMVGKVTKEDVNYLFQILDRIEQRLDESDGEDIFGSKGWRYHFGL